MFCPKCGKTIADDAKFCKFCGAQLGGEQPAPAPAPESEPAPAPAPAPKKAPKAAKPAAPVNGLFSLLFMSVLFVLCFTPFVNPGLPLLSFYAFDVHALFGIAKIFLIIALVLYFCTLATKAFSGIVSKILPEKIGNLLNQFLPLAFYGLYLFSQLFIFIGCIVVDGVTMGTAWYLMLIFAVCGAGYELLGLTKKGE